MAKAVFTKRGTITIKGLTVDEFDVLCSCLSRCQDVMNWNEEEGYADDGDNFLWRIDDRKEFDTLQSLTL